MKLTRLEKEPTALQQITDQAGAQRGDNGRAGMEEEKAEWRHGQFLGECRNATPLSELRLNGLS